MKIDVLVTGSTGKTGLPLVRRLTEAGVPVRALIHSPAKRSLIESKNVEIVVGDFALAGLLERALDGISIAYLVSPASPEQVKHQINFVTAAKAAGVKHIVKLSELGTAPDSPVNLLRWHAEIEEYIRKSGINYTFLHPHFFMENFLVNAESVKKESAIYSPLGGTKVNPVSIRDVVAVAATILREGGHTGKTYTLTGPEALSYGEIAQILSAIIGKPVRYVTVTFEAAKTALMKSGTPAWLAEDMSMLLKSWGAGSGSIVSQYVERITGKKPLSMQEFLLEHRGLFLAAA